VVSRRPPPHQPGDRTAPGTPAPRPTIVWFRQDLRVTDNPALAAAVASGGPILAIFIWAPHEEGEWAPGAASRWWLHHALLALDAELGRLGNRLMVARPAGPGETRAAGVGGAARTSLGVLEALASETGARTVHWNRRYEPTIVARDTVIKTRLAAAGLEVQTFNASLLHEPWALRTQAGQPFRVFTPFWRAFLAGPEPAVPLPAPRAVPALSTGMIRAAAGGSGRPRLDAIGLLPAVDWAGGLRETWTPGEAPARRRLGAFLSGAIGDYSEARDRPARSATSRLSAHLHFGELSPREVWWAVRAAANGSGAPSRASADVFLRELGWREFSHHLLFHFPTTPERPLRPEFERFPWRSAPDDLRAWQRGRTGYPLVDAGMRELWRTGTMHNRVRMVVASFLVKHLLVPWQAGARWFWDTLVDADLAQNTLGWQWTAGTGADAAPYFRVLNPVLQGQKFDPQGDYVRRFVPELARLDAAVIHAPWTGSEAELERAGVRLGVDYPRPIVEHGAARARALAAFETLPGRLL
jgi:deoxyribodipyrimidine photo-lyase